MQALTDFLLPLFLALGSLWFAVDLVKKLRAPAPRAQPVAAPLTSAPAPDPSEPVPSLPHSLPPAPTPPPTPAPPSDSAPALPPAHLAVIAATIHHLFRGRARVVGVGPAGAHATAAVDWAREGRRDIFSSHRLR